ncbi:MAG: restriction endonuclease subunit S [Sodaliphilus sp.]|nr:restriction endonuclease subunit S [Sodaliphilus sp.]
MEWEEVTIADIAILKNGKKRPTSQGTIPVYGGNGIMDYVDVYNDEYNIVVGRVGAYCGCVYLSKGKCWVSDNAISVKAKQGTDNKFLFYLLCNQNINHYHIGGAQPLMTQDIISRIEVSIPKSEEHQHQIAIILSALDSKIENNNKINANLEAQAQALFKSWFVDFTPFKDQPFVDSELGPIPQGWKVGTLFDVANLHDRYRRPLSSNQRSLMAKKYPYYGATSLMDFVEDYIFDGEYVLMGEDGSVVTEKGYPFIQYVWGKIWVNNHAHVLSGKDGFPTELLIPFLKTYNIKGLVTGAVQAKLNQANMAQIQIPIPPKKNINNLSVIIKSIYKKYRLLTEENQRLAALRDTLLPKLMSGEIKL